MGSTIKTIGAGFVGITIIRQQNMAMTRITNHTKPVKLSERFINEIDEIITERVKKGLDKKTRSLREMVDLISYHDFWVEIKRGMLEFKFPGTKI